jgi:chromosome partitioning protein
MTRGIDVIISVANQKGGVGKTTTVYALGAALAQEGAEVLLIDLDPQSSLTISAGLEPQEMPRSIYNTLVGGSELPVFKVKDGLHLAPSNIDLSAAEMELINEFGRERILRDALEPHLDRFNSVIIDSPPSLGLLTINALTAADTVLIPVNSEYLAMRGLQLLLDTIEKVRTRLNDKLGVLGILPTMFDKRTLHAKEVLAELSDRFGGDIRIFPPVGRSVRFAEAPIVGQSILEYADDIDGAAAYRELAKGVYRGC